MRIVIGSDHAGYDLKQHLIGTLKELGHDVDDLGTHSTEPVDYPPICAAVARRVAEGQAERGVVLGGSGQGEQISANKVHGARAALCNDLYTARMARAHNDANVLSIGARIVAQRCAAPGGSLASVAHPGAVGDTVSWRRRRHCSSSARVRVGEGVARNSAKSSGVSISSAMRGSRTTVGSMAQRLAAARCGS